MVLLGVLVMRVVLVVLFISASRLVDERVGGPWSPPVSRSDKQKGRGSRGTGSAAWRLLSCWCQQIGGLQAGFPGT
ncbi:hypothetical protein GCM10023340_44400 [Nocardioides marinquilinus]|uniref:Secreted protein n=1 Tax=Nocardioides marinquilinus TaxID=1210400 RepID=A0ABP9Q3V4_9ACTN